MCPYEDLLFVRTLTYDVIYKNRSMWSKLSLFNRYIKVPLKIFMERLTISYSPYIKCDRKNCPSRSKFFTSTWNAKILLLNDLWRRIMKIAHFFFWELIEKTVRFIVGFILGWNHIVIWNLLTQTHKHTSDRQTNLDRFGKWVSIDWYTKR